MLTCLAMIATLAAASPSIPDLAQEVERDARALSAQTEVTPAFEAALADFSTDAMALSDTLRATGMTADLPCIFKGISEDAHVRLEEFQAADSDSERAMAMSGLRALLDDAILLAPIAVREASGQTRPEDHADAAAQTRVPN